MRSEYSYAYILLSISHHGVKLPLQLETSSLGGFSHTLKFIVINNVSKRVGYILRDIL